MEIITYLLKVNIGIALLYGFYRLFFQNDTFFQWKRVSLLSVFFIALLYPLGDIFQQLLRDNSLKEVVILSPTYYLKEIIIDGKGMENSISAENSLLQLLYGIYCLVALILLFRAILQIMSIFTIIHRATSKEIEGQKVYLDNEINAPFSFFKWIVINPNQRDENEISEILSHEKTHFQQGHSIDTLICEGMCIICWFNPFVWLMKREIRMNLEYLADRSVIDSGCDRKHYQFHLLRLSYHTTAVKLSNNFNVSPLKKRILMMNKKQTSKFGLTKYLLFIPLVATLLFFNSMDIISNENVVSGSDPVVNSAENQEDNKKEIYTHVEVMPQFPGGEKEMLKFLSENLEYPIIAKKDSIEGRVVVRFVVNDFGKIEDVEILKSVHPLLDQEAIRVAKKMPTWIPGKQKEKAVTVYFILPVIFKLN